MTRRDKEGLNNLREHKQFSEVPAEVANLPPTPQDI